MRKTVFLFLGLLVSYSVSSQNIFGKWKTIDGGTGKAKSIVEIYEEDGKVFGKIIEILEVAHKDDLCKKCTGKEKNKPILGLVLIKNMVKDGKYYRKGSIFHPVIGRKFRCRMQLTKDKDILQVRGYIAFLYASQYWIRVKK